MSDLDAIREDVAMAARSAEMARHVALDHTPVLLDQIKSLKSDVEVLARQRETLWDALEQVLHVGLNDGMEWETVEQIVKDGPGKFDVLALLERLDPSPRRVETAEEPDAAPTGQRNMWDSFCDDCECIHCKPMDWEPWHGKASS